MNKLNKQQREEITKLKELPDNQIDTSDIPERNDWKEFDTGRFYRPIKKQVTIRLDIDMLEWFKAQGEKYQTRINKVLREYMDKHKDFR